MESSNFVTITAIYVTIVVCEVLTGVTMKSTVFLDVMPCITVNTYKCFGGLYYLHLQDQRVSQARNQELLHLSYVVYSSTMKIEAV
jgi:hypothetical protein